MDSVSIVALASIFAAGLAMGIGSIGPALGMGAAIAQALAAIAQQRDQAAFDELYARYREGAYGLALT